MNALWGAMNATGGYTHMEAMGGETFAKTAKAPPLQSALRGIAIDHHLRPQTSMGTA